MPERPSEPQGPVGNAILATDSDKAGGQPASPTETALLFALFAILAAASVAWCWLPSFRGLEFLRAAPTLALVVAAFLNTRAHFGFHITLGALCGACGDYFLASAARDWFIPGLLAFLAGHLFYIAAFRSPRRLSPGRWIVTGIIAAAMFALVGALIFRFAGTDQQHLLAPIAVYGLVIAVMASAAVFFDSNTRFIAAGAIVFVISDAHIAVNHMLLPSPILLLSVSGYTTYYLAQALIVGGAIAHRTRG